MSSLCFKCEKCIFYFRNLAEVFVFLAVVIAAFFSVCSEGNEEVKRNYDLSILSVDPEGGNNLLQVLRGEQSIGAHLTDIVVNNKSEDALNLYFLDLDGKVGPCVTSLMLKKWGVEKPEKGLGYNSSGCLTEYKESGLAVEYNYQTLSLAVDIPPSLLMSEHAKNMESSDDGINAAFTNYRFNASHFKTKYKNYEGQKNIQSTSFAEVSSGVNIGAWRVRNYLNFTGHEDRFKAKSLYSYAYTDINSLSSYLKFGQINTSALFFDVQKIYGVELATNIDMLPTEYQSYTPSLSGYAMTNARVTVSQQNVVIYETTVSPGSFELLDVKSPYSSNFVITVYEQDGSSREFVVQNASYSKALTHGHSRYSVSFGYLESNNNPMLQSTFHYGLTDMISVYAGAQTTNDYQSVVLGQAFALGPLGSPWVDLTNSQAKSEQKTLKGSSYRIGYSGQLEQLNSSFDVTYEMTRANFVSLTDHVAVNEYFDNLLLKDRLEARINYLLPGNIGILSAQKTEATYLENKFYNTPKNSSSTSIVFGSSFRGLSFGLNYVASELTYANGKKKVDNTAYLNIAMPLSSGRNRLSVSRLNQSSIFAFDSYSGDRAVSAYIKSTLYDDGSYKSTDLGGGYSGRYGEINGAVSSSNYGDFLTYGGSSGVLVSEHGVVFSGGVNETSALVYIKDVKDARFLNDSAALTNGRGYALLSGMTPYNINYISVNTDAVSDNFEITNSRLAVVPTQGAIVYKEFKYLSGLEVLFNIKTEKAIPFGAIAYIDGTPTDFIVDENLLYLKGLKSGVVDVSIRWGDKDSQRCSISYDVPIQKKDQGLQVIPVECT